MGIHADLLERHRAVIPPWVGLYYDEPISLVDGSDRHVIDAEGNRYLDFFGGILVTIAGHAVPRVIDAIKAQADRMLHTSTLYLMEAPDRAGGEGGRAVRNPERQGVLRQLWVPKPTTRL